MGTESIEASFLSIFALITFFIFLIINKYSSRIKNGALLDTIFNKPQAFHETPVSRSGGAAILISFLIFLTIYYLLYSKILYEYLFISLSMFLIGFLDDLKIYIQPLKRLILMVSFLIVIIYFFQIIIEHIEIPFLKFLLKNEIFSTFFVLICFLFIINGAI